MDDELLALQSSFQPARLLVLGDLMLDRTQWVRKDRLSANGSLRLTAEESTTDRPGGAAYVAKLLSQLGNKVVAAGVIGPDTEGRELVRSLTSAGIEADVLLDEARPTTLKERFVDPQHRVPQLLMRVDHERTGPLPSSIEATLCKSLVSTIRACDGVLLSDYAKGVCTPQLVATVIATARSCGIPIVVDPARRSTFARFAGSDVITPNRQEAEVATGMTIQTPDHALEAGCRLCAESDVDACVVTLDADGAVLTTRNGNADLFPAEPRTAVDPTGAGDAFAASLLQGLVSGQTLEESVRLANLVAGFQVEHFGAASVAHDPTRIIPNPTPPATTEAKSVSVAELPSLLDVRRRNGERIVLTNGCFDLLHAGHVDYLEEAAAEGECLVVAVNADRTVSRLKGNQRPVVPQQERARLLAALACVDYVVIFEEETPHAIIRHLRPDVLVKGGDYALEDVVGRELVESFGGTVKTLGLTAGLSTTQILHRITAPPSYSSHAG